MSILVAPTEPKPLKKLGVVSGMPERYGCDFLWSVEGGLCGVQRKEISDLLASIRDGRLNKEIAQLQSVQHKLLVVEGTVQWTDAGMLMHEYTVMGRQALNGMLFSVRAKGVWVQWTASMGETAELVWDYFHWTQKDEHTSLMGRPGPVTPWGRATNNDYAIHVLTSFPGVGVELARRIIEYFGGLPLKWDVTEQQLMEIDGIGKVKAKRLMEVLEHE